MIVYFIYYKITFRKSMGRFYCKSNSDFMSRSSHQRYSVKNGVLRNFTKFTGKYLCQSLIFKVCNFVKNETLAQVFSCEFCDISKNILFTEHLWTTAS